AFAHESGIHQHGMLAHSETYEIMTPASVGVTETTLVMGKHSGSHAFGQKLKELGFELGENALAEAFAQFKALADRKKEIYDEDNIALINPRVHERNEKLQFVSLQVACGSKGPQTAALVMKVDGKEQSVVSEGNGPVD